MGRVEYISGGVCAPRGYKAAGVYCGVRKNRTKRDLALIYSEKRAAAAAVYTQNLVKGAPLTVTKRHLADGFARAIICNSGNANTCNANGEYIAETTCALLAAELGIAPEDVIVASTGVIGQAMSMEPFERGIPELVKALGADSAPAAEAIMTTDTHSKEMAVSFTAGGVECRMGCMAKGSGMICPNMATMLGFITSDCAISPAMLAKALSEDIPGTFNMVTVDGDTSTNDMVALMSNGMAGNAEIASEGADYDAFREALHTLTVWLSRQIAGDGEGATKLLDCVVTGAKTLRDARTAAKAVVGLGASQGRDVRRGRQLGPRPLRGGLFRRGRGYNEGRCELQVRRGRGHGLRERRGRGFLGGAGREGARREGDIHPRQPRRRGGGGRGLGLRTSLTNTSR